MLNKKSQKLELRWRTIACYSGRKNSEILENSWQKNTDRSVTNGQRKKSEKFMKFQNET